MMFYTGEDLSQPHGPLPTSNGTLATLNQKKFQRRQSEKEMTLISEDGKYFDDSQIFYREKEVKLTQKDKELNSDAEKYKSDFRSTDNLPDLVTESEIRAQSVTQVESFSTNSFDFQQTDPIVTESGKSELKLDFGTQESVNEEEQETKRGKLVRGLKSVDNPDVITFREQSEWLDKLVTEELKSQKIKKEKESQEQTPRFVTEPTIVPTPVNASQSIMPSDVTSPAIEESPIVLQSRKEWLETLAQQGFSPRSNDSSSDRTTNRLSKMESIKREIPSQQLSSSTNQNQFSMQSTNENQFSMQLTNENQHRESPSNQNYSSGDEETRGNAFMMPSKIKELKSTTTTPREPYSSHERGHTQGPRFTGFTHTKVSKIPSGERQQITASVNSGTTLNQKFDGLNITDQGTNNSPDFRASVNDHPQKPDRSEEVDYTPAGVKDRLKAFQSPRGTTQSNGYSTQTPPSSAGDFIVQVEKSPSKISGQYSQRPKSYHSETTGSGDYRYYGNDYDSTNFHPVAQQQRLDSKPNMRIELIPNQGNSNIGKTGIIQNPKNEKLDSNNNANLDFEYKHCVKDSRILREIAEQENRENEIRKQRHYGNSPSSARHHGNNLSNGGLELFLQENERR